MKRFLLFGLIAFAVVELIVRFVDPSSSAQGTPLDVDFTEADVSELRNIIADSAAGKFNETFRKAINESLAQGGAAVPIDTSVKINAGGIVIGRVDTELKGWVEAKDGKWQFEGSVSGISERFDFSDEPKRSRVRDAITRIVGALGHATGAADFDAYYVGGIAVRAEGDIRS